MAHGMVDPLGLVGQRLEEKYELHAVANSGGFGVVYRATQIRLHRPVAVKVLKQRPDLSDASWENILSSFQTEAAIIAALTHPNIVQAIDYGVVRLPGGGMAPWLALEWLEGDSLKDWLAQRDGSGGVTPAECIERFTPLLRVVAFLHRKGLVHRDLKPENVMLARNTGDEVLKLLDFGLAKVMEDPNVPNSGATITQSVGGGLSPRYAAPEQIGRTRTGPWTDVYAIGLMLTEALTGQRAYRGAELTAWFAEALSPTRPTPAKFGVDVGAWEAVIARSVALSPAARYRDAGELLVALEHARPAPDPARPAIEQEPSTIALPPKTRRPIRVALASAVALAFIAATAVSAAFLRGKAHEGEPAADARAIEPDATAPSHPRQPQTAGPTADAAIARSEAAPEATRAHRDAGVRPQRVTRHPSGDASARVRPVTQTGAVGGIEFPEL